MGETKKLPKYNISRELGLILDKPSEAIHELDQMAYQYGENLRKNKLTAGRNKYVHNALSKD
jgi:hypothetical protein